MEDKYFIPALLSCSHDQARDEGLTDEEAIVDRANQIFQDAQLAEPSELGKVIRAKAIKKLETDPVYSAKPKFDYDGHKDKRALPAIAQLLNLFANNGEQLAKINLINATPADEEEINKTFERVTIDIFTILNANNIGTGEYKHIFDSLKLIVTAFDEYTMKQVVGHRHEMMSRLFGAKNPGTGRYDSTYALYTDLTAALMKVREQTGNEMSDYFNVEKAQEE